jgi:malate dehydrogenase
VSKKPVRVAVTGAAGQIAYSLHFRISNGDRRGPDQPIELRLLDIEPAMNALDAVVMELDDCAFPLLMDVETTFEPKVAFDGVSWALLVGSMPRKEGMERKDLIAANAGIFAPQGQALAASAANDVRILVVGNPCNTNCLIARANGREIPADRWFAMTRLDQNRAQKMLAQKANVHVTDVTNVAIWGNHSNTQFPDYQNARIDGKRATKAIKDEKWFKDEFLPTIQQRGAAVIKARGGSSAASAANAAIDSVRSVWQKTPKDDCVSLGVPSDGSYGIPEGLQFSFPIRSKGDSWKIVDGFEHDGFAKEKIRATMQELIEEREGVKELLPS